MRNIALIAVTIIAWTVAFARGDDMQNPHVSFADVDWDAVQASLSRYEMLKPEAGGDASSPNEIVRLNTATFERFPGIAKSSVPVLLPFDIATYLSDHAAGVDQTKSTDAYLAGFHTTKFFFPGPSGYDATFAMRPNEVLALKDMNFSDQAEVLISDRLYSTISRCRILKKAYPCPH